MKSQQRCWHSAVAATILLTGLLTGLAGRPAAGQIAIDIDPPELARLRAAAVEAARESAAGAEPVQFLAAREIMLGQPDSPDSPREVQDLYIGLQPSNNGFWFWTTGGSEVCYWALDDARMGPSAPGGARVTRYEFSFGVHADFDGDRLRPFVVVSFYNAPFDPVAWATNPVVEPPQPVSSIGWLFAPYTLPEAGFYVARTGLINLEALGLDFELEGTFYVEILPLEWSSYPQGSPIADPDVFAVFTGPNTVTYGENQDHMWSLLWCLKGGCDPQPYPTGNLHYGDNDAYYDHPAEMYDGGCSPYMNQSGIRLRGTPCQGPVLMVSVDKTCLCPGENLTATLSQSCVGAPVRGYQAFLAFDNSKLMFQQGTYITPLPYGLPIITPIAAVGGNIDLAAGIDDLSGQHPTSTSANLATLTFVAGPGEGLSRVSFRPHDPPTRFSDVYGDEILPILADSPQICVDGTPPEITCPPNLSLQCPAQIPAAATNYYEFVAQGGSATDAQCYPDVPPELTHQGDSSNGGAGCPNDPLVITRTYRATDCAGNYAECTQTITVLDNTPPQVTDCPDDMTATPAPGYCEAQVSWAPPTVTDNCGGNVTVEYLIDIGNDGEVDYTITQPSYTFPGGQHRVTVRATDSCGNANQSCSFLVTVNNFNNLAVNVELQWPFNGTRCITFEVWNCDPLQHEVIQETLNFSNGLASATLHVPCGNYTCITARDRLHTLRRTTDLGIAGNSYTAAFTDSDKLIGGNLNDDRWIDILDFGVFSWQWGTIYADGGNTNCQTQFPHADIALGDTAGKVGIEDFSFVQINFLYGHEANCCGQPGLLMDDEARSGPIMRIAVDKLAGIGLGELAAGDLNGDGWLDTQDIAPFMQGARPKAVSSPAETTPHRPGHPTGEKE